MCAYREPLSGSFNGEPKVVRSSGITNVKSDYRVPWVSVSACYLADDLQNLMNFFLHESLPRARALGASEREAASYQGPRVATPSVASLYPSRINYTLMRGNALPIVKVRAGWRVSALRSRGESHVGYPWNSTVRALPKAPFLEPLVELASVILNYNWTPLELMVYPSEVPPSSMRRDFTSVLRLNIYSRKF